MDLLRPSVLTALCVRVGVRPDRRAGQHFLVNRATLDRIVAAVDPQPGDTILEVGAGFGVLTCALAERLSHGERHPPPLPPSPRLRRARAPHPGGRGRTEIEVSGRVIAIERDRRITPMLRELTALYGHVEVVEEDVLQWLRSDHAMRVIARPAGNAARSSGGHSAKQSRAISTNAGVASVASLPRNDTGKAWKLVANLPYSITSDFLRRAFNAVGTGALPPPERAVLLLQREVVDRLCADPSRHREHRNVGMLTMLTQLHCSPRRIARVPPSHFWPAPTVESAVVALDTWRTPEEIEMLLGGGSPPPLAPHALTRHPLPLPLGEGESRPGGKGRTKRDEFLRLVRSCFASRRRQLHRLLKPHISGLTSQVFKSIGIDPTARPETLTLERWVALARVITERL